MSTSSWFEKALSNDTPAPPPAPPTGPQQGSSAFPTYEPQSQTLPTQHVQPSPGTETSFSEALMSRRNDYAAQNTPSMKAGDVSACPGCGSPNYFSRGVAGSRPRPHCFDCGYPISQGPA